MLTSNSWSLKEFRNARGSLSRISGTKDDGTTYNFLQFGSTNVSFSHKLGVLSKEELKSQMDKLQIVEGVDDETGTTFFCLCNKNDNAESLDDIF